MSLTLVETRSIIVVSEDETKSDVTGAVETVYIKPNNHRTRRRLHVWDGDGTSEAGKIALSAK